jgi:cyclopropane fatty-acyl-phospholipid synthase-like methyltransferase
VEYFRHKFTRTCEIEQDNLKQSQDEMKHWYENKVIVRYAFRLNRFVFNLIDAKLAEINETYNWILI